MKKFLLLNISLLGILSCLCSLQGCETCKGVTGEDKGITKISQGVGKDIENTWGHLMDLDKKLRENLW